MIFCNNLLLFLKSYNYNLNLHKNKVAASRLTLETTTLCLEYKQLVF